MRKKNLKMETRNLSFFLMTMYMVGGSVKTPADRHQNFYPELWSLIIRLKGTVNVISSDPLYKDSNARYTTEPLKL